MKLYVDDTREVPDESWVLARTITEAINFIMLYGDLIKEISLDHDISYEIRVNGVYTPFPSPDNFASLAYFIVKYYDDIGESKPFITIHTANQAGADKLEAIMLTYDFKYQVKMMGQAHRKK